MREIKFRAWDRLNKKIVTSGLSINIDTTDRVIPVSFTQGDIAYCRDNDVNSVPNIHSDIELMQYTGLKDKNGVEIYEGDLLGGIMEGFAIQWDDELKQLWPINQYMPEEKSDIHWYEIVEMADKNELEVIGNIYENPEALKKGK